MSVQGLIGGWNALMSWPGTTERVKEITTPALLMAGALEPAVESMTYIHTQIAGSTIVIIPEAGHSPQWERPELFNGALRAHLERNPAR